MSDVAPAHDAAELTRHIETRYHARHRQQLPPLVRMADMIEDLHDGDIGVPQGLFGVLRRMIDGMEVHMKEEELILFPAIRRGGSPQIGGWIAVMRANHDDHDRDVAEIRRLTDNLTLPRGACEPWVTLYAGLTEFIVDLEEHMRLENDVLFASFERAAGGLHSDAHGIELS